MATGLLFRYAKFMQDRILLAQCRLSTSHPTVYEAPFFQLEQTGQVSADRGGPIGGYVGHAGVHNRSHRSQAFRARGPKLAIVWL